MTPTEVAAKLRAFNDWRRGDEDIPQFDPREIGKVIDAAVEMIERLEAAEKDVALKEQVIDALGSELNAVANERDAAELMSLALRAKIAEMERQEPVAKVRVHQIEAGGYRDIGTDLTDDALAAIHMLGIIGTYGTKGATEMSRLFCDCKTDEEKSTFFLSGRAVETGVIAAAISNDVAMAYHRCSEFKKETSALRAKIDAMEKRLRLILEEPENTLSNSKALREIIRQAKLALKESK